MTRRHNFQTFAWFHDVFKRELLDLDPPYQRRSVWNQSFKDYFVETILLQYPSPAIFLYEEMSEGGNAIYHVVDGKQRLTTMLEFVADEFSVSEHSEIEALRGQYFSKLSPETKKKVWSYQFLVEYVPSDEETLIGRIFDRINRNVAKLSPQELRHAKYSGVFISVAEALTDWMNETLPQYFPRIAEQSRRQMKDVEFVALLLLLLEKGASGFSQTELDTEFSGRDDDWEHKSAIERRFRETIEQIQAIIKSGNEGQTLLGTRLRNQVDFYALFGAVSSLLETGSSLQHVEAATRLRDFVATVDDEDARRLSARARKYYEAARSASSDKGSREVRISAIREVLAGKPDE